MIGKINRNPTTRELHQFGWIMMAGLSALAALLAWRGHPAPAPWLVGGGVLIAVLSYVWPSAARCIYRGWMTFGQGMAWVVSHVILTVVFFVMVTPVALVFKLIKRDELRLKRDPSLETYWIEHRMDKSRESYKHLY